MTTSVEKTRLAIIGGGPGALFLFKELLETVDETFTIDIFESKDRLGYGMPYGREGANTEHITNVSGNEIPKLITPVMQWLKALPADEVMDKYQIDLNTFTEFMVFPRLLFGDYLHAQFELLLDRSQQKNICTKVHLRTTVIDVIDDVDNKQLLVTLQDNSTITFDQVIISIGHTWPLVHEGKVPGYYDSPYPPSKLALQLNHKVAIRGASLTAIDAVRTIARHNGQFVKEGPHKLSFVVNEQSKNFKIIMHSKDGLLPAVRFHLSDPRLSDDHLLSAEDICCHIEENGGFLSLDFIFEKDFKEPFKEKDPAFYAFIKNMTMETFVDAMMRQRENTAPFELFKNEYAEAAKSIREKKSVYWKEALAILSFTMNYPAKHFSAEDMLRLQKTLMPLISIVIAFVPQSSCEEMIALHDAGVLELISVDQKSHVEVNDQQQIIYYHTDENDEPHEMTYKTYIDAVGQKHLSIDDFPFKSLANKDVLSAATLAFRSPENATTANNKKNKDIVKDADGQYVLKVSGITIDDFFRTVNAAGDSHSRLHIMAVPYIGGYNPDYSGLDFCEKASGIIAKDIMATINN